MTRHGTNHPTKAFSVATEHLYDAFRPVPFDPQMIRVEGSVTDQEVAALGADVTTLPATLLVRFVLKVGTTWGGPHDLRRVTPRLLELAADHALPIDRALLWSKLAWADWENWPTHQARVVREFTYAEWRRLLCSPPRPAHLAHRWLTSAVYGVSDIAPYLDRWQDELDDDDIASHHRAVTGHLVLLLNNAVRPDFPQTIDSLFSAHPPAADRLRGFLADRRTFELLDRAAYDLRGTTDERRASLALERLRRLRSRLHHGTGEIGAGPASHT